MNYDNASLLRRQPKGRRLSLGNGNTKVKYQLTINRRNTNLYVHLVLAIILHALPGCFPMPYRVCSLPLSLLLCLENIDWTVHKLMTISIPHLFINVCKASSVGTPG